MRIGAKILTPDGEGEVMDYNALYVWVFITADMFTQKYYIDDCRIVI